MRMPPLMEIAAEIKRGRDLYGPVAMSQPFLSPRTRVDVLAAEVDEVRVAVAAGDVDGPHGVRAELIQVAAVALAWLGVIDG